MSQWDAGGTKNSQRSALFSRMHASEGKGNYWLSSPQVFPESQEHRFLRFATSNMLLTAPPSDSVWPFGFSNVSGKACNWNKEEMEPYPTHQSLRMTWGEKQRKKCRTLVSAKRNGSAWEHNDSMSPFLGPETQYVGHALLHPIARRKTQRGPPAQKKDTIWGYCLFLFSEVVASGMLTWIQFTWASFLVLVLPMIELIRS